MKTLLVISLGLFAMALGAPCCWANERGDMEKGGKEAAALLSAVYEKSWPIVEESLSYFRNKELMTPCFMMGMFSRFSLDTRHDCLYLFDDSGDRYTIDIDKNKLILSKEKEGLMSFDYKIEKTLSM